MAKDFQGVRAQCSLLREIKNLARCCFFFWFLMNLEKVSNARGVAG